MVTDEQERKRGQGSVQNQGSEIGNRQLAIRLGELARDLQHNDDPDSILQTIVAAAIELIPGVEEGSVSVVRGRKHVVSRAPSGELPVAVDAIETETGEGPCLDAAYQGITVRVSDMATEQRWPRFAKRAYEAGAASMLSFQLYVEDDNLGALNLYARKPGAFTDKSEQIGLLVAAHAAVGYADAQKAEQLAEAIDTRDLIGQAKGVLMERFKITAEQAFLILARTSSETNTKLRDVADRLVATGELPGQQSSR